MLLKATLADVLGQHAEAQSMCNGYHLYVVGTPEEDALFRPVTEWTVASRSLPFPRPMARAFRTVAGLERELRNWLEYEPGAAIWLPTSVLLIASDAVRSRLEQLIGEGLRADDRAGAASAFERLADLLSIDLAGRQGEPEGAPRWFG